MNQTQWDEKLKSFLKKTGEDVKRAGTEIKSEAEKELALTYWSWAGREAESIRDQTRLFTPPARIIRAYERTSAKTARTATVQSV